ncbi:MAG: sulfite exporter TauE/SafE family protein [Candidatus Lindowbacteria bacterium]|nr:sulfite exporter TauE/SafE family protein [Candidatus Lindowbacteria bacterium]
MFAGLLYTAGRTFTYVLLGVFLVTSLLSAPRLSHLLQKYMNQLLGPVLILVGMFLLDMIKFNLMSLGISDQMKNRVESMGVMGALLLGALFALSFCPVSAALFFGSLIPLAVKSGSDALLPSVYGVGTALPVVLFAILIAFGVHSVGTVFNKVASCEVWARRITGVVFIGLGVYFSLAYIFQIF